MPLIEVLESTDVAILMLSSLNTTSMVALGRVSRAVRAAQRDTISTSPHLLVAAQPSQVPVRNSGWLGGVLLKRAPLMKDAKNYFRPSDFVVGEILKLNHFTYRITDADEFALKCVTALPLLLLLRSRAAAAAAAAAVSTTAITTTPARPPRFYDDD